MHPNTLSQFGSGRLILFLIVVIGVLASAGGRGWAQDGGGLSAAQQASLEQIIETYNRTAGWETYTAQTSEAFNVAFSLDMGTGADPYGYTDNIRRSFDSAYNLPQRAAQGAFTLTQTLRETSGRQTISSKTVRAAFDLVGVEGRVYVSGSRTATPGDGQDLDFPDFIQLDEDVIEQLGSIRLQRWVDFDLIRSLQDTVELLETATDVSSAEVVSLRQYEGQVQVYQIEVDPIQGIETLSIDVDGVLNNPALNGVVNRDVFYELLPDNSTLTVNVYLDVESGALVGEQMVLSIGMELSGDGLVNAARGVFTLQLDFDSAVLYLNINQPVMIEEPQVR
jgi:hypothetical protein